MLRRIDPKDYFFKRRDTYSGEYSLIDVADGQTVIAHHTVDPTNGYIVTVMTPDHEVMGVEPIDAEPGTRDAERAVLEVTRRIYSAWFAGDSASETPDMGGDFVVQAKPALMFASGTWTWFEIRWPDSGSVETVAAYHFANVVGGGFSVAVFDSAGASLGVRHVQFAPPGAASSAFPVEEAVRSVMADHAGRRP